MYTAGLVGITGYTGMELARALVSHPQINLTVATSRQEQGKKVADLYPFLRGHALGNLEISDADAKELAEKCDVVFLAIPHGVAMDTAAQILEAAENLKKSVKVIDLSADFRIKDIATYEQWYGVTHTQKKYVEESVYGLIEINAEAIKKARLVANPGCYPTASILGLYPALQGKIIKLDDIVIDAKSGTSGAGRKASVPTLFCEVQDNFRPYGLGKHRHTPEIEQELSLIAHSDITLSFNPHLLPIQRGILTTIYSKLTQDYAQEDIQKIYEDTWKDCPFIRVLPAGQFPETRYVRGSMFCDIAVTVDKRTQRLIITSAIDNLARGASLQALANANLTLGLPLKAGIDHVPLCP